MCVSHFQLGFNSYIYTFLTKNLPQLHVTREHASSLSLVFSRYSNYWGPVGGGGGGGGGGGVVMSAVAVLKSSMSLFETCQMSLSEFRTNSAIMWTTRFLYIGLMHCL
jgi:hypothetical protein